MSEVTVSLVKAKRTGAQRHTATCLETKRVCTPDPLHSLTLDCVARFQGLKGPGPEVGSEFP